jgi:hypothetical protein
MEINLRSLHNVQELRRLLESKLVIGKATVTETQEFLRQQELSCSEASREGDKQLDALLKVYGNRTSVQFDCCIGCKIPVKPSRVHTRNPVTWFQSLLNSHLVKWEFMVRFYFVKEILAEIAIEKVGTGF